MRGVTRTIGRMEPTGLRNGVPGWSDLGHMGTIRKANGAVQSVGC